jgi:hypothetical protein
MHGVCCVRQLQLTATLAAASVFNVCGGHGMTFEEGTAHASDG